VSRTAPLVYFQGGSYRHGMAQRCEEYVDALESGDPDRVNPVIDELQGMEVDERARVYDACFEAFVAVYADSSDGYVRQSVVRAAEQLVPRLEAIALVSDDDIEEWLGDTSVEELRSQTDTLSLFLIKAIQDGDGRVRNAAKRGLKDVFRAYDGVSDTDTIISLIAELDDLSERYAGKREEHILEATESAEFFLQSPGVRILEGLQKSMDRRRSRDD